MKKIIIAVDGFSSCGKSTLAKQLAKRLDYVFIDTGAMYRGITLYFLNHHLDWTQEVVVAKALPLIHLVFKFVPTAGKNELFLNDQNVAVAIREPRVADKVSEVAALKAVREFAVAQQQRMGADGGVVMDGRDIGTVVFPHAELKIFMTAAPEIRAQRRYKELLPTHPNITLEEVKANLEKRDYIDTHRAESPLRQASDARLLDNSDLTPEAQLDLALSWVNEILK